MDIAPEPASEPPEIVEHELEIDSVFRDAETALYPARRVQVVHISEDGWDIRYQFLHRRGHPLNTQIWVESASRFLWSNGPWIPDDTGRPVLAFTQNGKLVMPTEAEAPPPLEGDVAFVLDHELVDESAAEP